ILIPYNWDVDCSKWKETGENRNSYSLILTIKVRKLSITQFKNFICVTAFLIKMKFNQRLID
ncbi:MAG: hypothetical protein ACKPBT_18805, partial [Microcystis aeruginosa]